MDGKMLKRVAAIEKPISEIDPRNDIRVRITGTVIGIDDDSIMIDDGSGKTEVFFENPVSYVKSGQMVRIIARVLPLVDGFECKGECVQSMEGFDINLFKDARKIIKG